MPMLERVSYALFVIILAALLAACVPDEGTQPTPHATPTQEFATWTPEPTSVAGCEVPDCNTFYYPLNGNPDMLAGRVIEGWPDADGITRRYQCVPSGMDFTWTPRPTGPQTPPFINCDLDHRKGGNHRVEVESIDGSFHWRESAVEVVPNRCYLLKIVGDNDTTLQSFAATLSLDNVDLNAVAQSSEHLFATGNLYPLDGSNAVIPLPAAPFPLDDDFDIFWPIITSRAIPAVLEFEVGFTINWAVYGGVISMDEIIIEQVPLSDGFCNLPNTTQW